MINCPGLVFSPYFYTPDPAIKAFLIPERARNLQLFHMVSFRRGERPLMGFWRLKKKKPKAKQKDKCQNKQEQIPRSPNPTQHHTPSPPQTPDGLGPTETSTTPHTRAQQPAIHQSSRALQPGCHHRMGHDEAKESLNQNERSTREEGLKLERRKGDSISAFVSQAPPAAFTTPGCAGGIEVPSQGFTTLCTEQRLCHTPGQWVCSGETWRETFKPSPAQSCLS